MWIWGFDILGGRLKIRRKGKKGRKGKEERDMKLEKFGKERIKIEVRDVMKRDK